MSDDASKIPLEDGQSPRMSEALGFHILNALHQFRAETRQDIHELRALYRRGPSRG